MPADACGSLCALFCPDVNCVTLCAFACSSGASAVRFLCMCACGSAIACVCACVSGCMRICAHLRVALCAHTQSARGCACVPEEGDEKNPGLVISNYFCWVIAWRVSSLCRSSVCASISSSFPLLSSLCLDGWWPMILQIDVIAPLWLWPDRPVQHILEWGRDTDLKLELMLVQKGQGKFLLPLLL